MSLTTWKGPAITTHRFPRQLLTIFSSKNDILTVMETSPNEVTFMLRHAHMKYICKTSSQWPESWLTVTIYDDHFVYFDDDGCEPSQASQFDIDALQVAYNFVN